MVGVSVGVTLSTPTLLTQFSASFRLSVLRLHESPRILQYCKIWLTAQLIVSIGLFAILSLALNRSDTFLKSVTSKLSDFRQFPTLRHFAGAIIWRFPIKGYHCNRFDPPQK